MIKRAIIASKNTIPSIPARRIQPSTMVSPNRRCRFKPWLVFKAAEKEVVRFGIRVLSPYPIRILLSERYVADFGDKRLTHIR